MCNMTAYDILEKVLGWKKAIDTIIDITILYVFNRTSFCLMEFKTITNKQSHLQIENAFLVEIGHFEF